MRIALDHQAFCLQRTGGISRYFVRLAQELIAANQQVGVFAPLYRNQYLRELPQDCVRGRAVANYPPRCADFAVFINGIIARRQLRSWHPEIVHETYFTKMKSGAVNCPTVLTVFDMISELGVCQSVHSNSEIKDSFKYLAVQRADHVICISENTKTDLVNLCDISPEKISVIHLGCDQIQLSDSPQTSSESQRLLSLDGLSEKPFLLYVGLRSGYKNFAGFLRGFASSTHLKKAFNVIAFGGGALTTVERTLIDDLKLEPNQIQQVSGDDFMLASMYRRASAFVYPSFYEGFGLPPLEAMLYQCPVVSSNSSSMPEVLGDAAEFFDPSQIGSMTQALERVVYSADRRIELINKGQSRIKAFTWKASAARHMAVYQSLSVAATNRI
jgi:glycosyltransferase involved in cell wall biosynthesis